MCYASAMNSNTVHLAADEFQRYQLEIAVTARTQALRRANVKAAGMARRMDKAATLAVLNRLRRK
jgi:hypothetical protein